MWQSFHNIFVQKLDTSILFLWFLKTLPLPLISRFWFGTWYSWQIYSVDHGNESSWNNQGFCFCLLRSSVGKIPLPQISLSLKTLLISFPNSAIVAQAAITNYHRLGGLNNQHYFSQYWRLGSLRSRCRQIEFWWGPSSWFADGRLPYISSHDKGQKEQVLLSLLTMNPIHEHSTLMAFKGPTS